MKKSFYETSDLSLASALSIYLPIAAINKQNPQKAQFVFERNSKLNSLLDKYWNKELLIEPRAYFDQLKAIKARLYAND